MLIFIYSLCFYLYILQCNSGFDLHMYIPLYLFTVHLRYNHSILIRYSYYIVVTYVHIVVSYYFFFLYLIMNWSLSVFIASSSFPVDNCIKLYWMFLDMGQLYLHIYACTYTFLIYLLHMYCIFAQYRYDILINYICLSVFVHLTQ